MSNPAIDIAAVIRANLSWSGDSSVMRPADGSWGIAGRLSNVPDSEAGNPDS